LQGRLTPLESVRQFRPMLAGKDSGKPSGLSANAGTPPPSASLSGDRPRRVRPVSGSPVRPLAGSGQPSATIERGDRSTVPEASASPAPVASRPRRIPATIERAAGFRNRSTVGRKRPRRRNAAPPFAPVSGSEVPASRGDRVPPASDDSGGQAVATVRPRRKRPACQRFDRWPEVRRAAGSERRRIRHHRTRRRIPASRPPFDRGDRAPRLSIRQAVANIGTPPEVCRACQRFGSRHHRTRRPCAATIGKPSAAPDSPRLSAGKDSPPPSNAGKPSGFRSKAATVRPCGKRKRRAPYRNAAQPIRRPCATVSGVSLKCHCKNHHARRFPISALPPFRVRFPRPCRRLFYPRRV